MKKLNKSLVLLSLVIFSLASCKKDKDDVPNPQEPNENELITTMRLLIADAANANIKITATFKDPDGEGGLAVTVFDTIRLMANKTYNVQVLLLNESKNPADTISNEVEEEGDEHQFFYTASGGANVTFKYTDADHNGVPVGLTSTFTTGVATTTKMGKINVTLKHQGEDKPNTGSGNAMLGSTDIEVAFPVIIR